MMSSVRTPTVEDLRVKLCYICREEELYDAVHDGQPRPWTHPCKCTLIAHESCLLQWIQTAQANPQRAKNALKCAQCGTQYELESEKSLALDIMSAGNRVLQRVGGMITVVGAAGVMGVMGSGVYIMFTAYGAWAVRQYVGKEMFDILLTDDPSNWPWTAFFNLPLLPLSLITSRITTSPTLPTLLPILLVWPPSPVAHQWMHHEPWHKRDRPHSPPLRAWPPSPIIFGLFIAPVVRMLYKKMLLRFARWLLGTDLRQIRRTRLGFQLNEGPFMIRIRANVQDANGNEQNVDILDQGNNDVGGGGDGAANNANEAPQDRNAANVAAAERLLEINATSLGRRIGGALLIPYISNLMGTLLFQLSKHSHILRGILGIKPHRRLLNGLPPSMYAYPFVHGSSVTERLGQLAKVIVGSLWGGSRTWVEFDPVWWRNSIGLGLFVAARDCLYLTHLWLTKREIETRKVKSRDFAGVDIKELDLAPTFPRPPPRVRRTSGSELVQRALGETR